MKAAIRRTIELEVVPTKRRYALNERGQEVLLPELWAFPESKALFELNLPEDWNAAVRELTRAKTTKDLAKFFNRMGYTRQLGDRFVPVLNSTEAWKKEDITDPIAEQWWSYRDILTGMLTAKGLTEKQLLASLPAHAVQAFKDGFGTIARHLVYLKAEGGLAVVVEGMTPLNTLVLHVHYQLMRGHEFGRCVRYDCQAVFPVKSAHRQQYCSALCKDTDKKRRFRERKNSTMKESNA